MDIDGDGIGYRTYPGTHADKGAFFTRGTSHDSRARYSEQGAHYVEGMQRLWRKLDTAKEILPKPLRKNAAKGTRYGVIYYGSTAPAMNDAAGALVTHAPHFNQPRVPAAPG